MMAELARKGELLGPRPKADPSRKPKRETIKMAPPTDNGREASLFFHTGSSVRERAPTVQVRISPSDVSSMLGQLEEVKKVKKEADQAIQGGQHKQAFTRDTSPISPALKTTSSPGTVTPETHASSRSPQTCIQSDLGGLEMNMEEVKKMEAEMEAEMDTMHTKEDFYMEGTEPKPPTTINNEWLKGIWALVNSDSASMSDIQNYIMDGIKKGYKLTRRHRKGAILGLYKKEEYRTVMELYKKLKCDDLHAAEFEAILISASRTNQWRLADRVMNKHWHLVEKGPAKISVIALQVFINVDFSLARAFIDQLMHDKRINRQTQEHVAYTYLHGARTVALNLSEMMRFANQYQDLPLMQSSRILGQLLRGFHQLGTQDQIKIFQNHLCSKGLDKLQDVKYAMFLRYLYLRRFNKALGVIKFKRTHAQQLTSAGYVAMANRHDWEGLLWFHKKVTQMERQIEISDTMKCCLIEAYGATGTMKQAIEVARTLTSLSPQAVSALFRVYCYHYPEQSGDLDRLLSSPAVAEIRVLTKHLDLRNRVPMMLISSSDVSNGVSTATFQRVHLKRRRAIEAMVKEGKPERAYKYYTLLTKTEIPFSEHDYLTLIRGLCQYKFLQLAEEILADFEQAIPTGSWRKRLCHLDVKMLKTKFAGAEGNAAGPPRVILTDYVKKYCTERGPRRDGPVLESPKYKTKSGYEWVVVGMHMVSQGMYVEARDFLKDARLREPMAYALLAECHARLGDVSAIEKLIKEMRAGNVRADQTYKTLLGITEFHYGTVLVTVMDKLKVLMDAQQQRAIEDQTEFLEVLVQGVRIHEEKKNLEKQTQKQKLQM
ncbi:hypothetical protein CJU90_6044 [Yarrowia sp. C11]|nr:hypothetical protein CJU90_6044 [Yarrowia sp. C11]KAG5370759.1 hypothetical protein CKK34_0884 [Yarrowia sp. E02]